MNASHYEIRVRFCETDLMGIVHHANYLLYCEAARVDWLRKRGVSYDQWVALGVHLPVVEAKVRFRRAVRFDEIVVVTTTVPEHSRVSVRFAYRIHCGPELACEAETLLACVGDDLKLKRMPPEVAAVFSAPQRTGTSS
jgi:acyl-CoA thioester hydrolase